MKKTKKIISQLLISCAVVTYPVWGNGELYSNQETETEGCRLRYTTEHQAQETEGCSLYYTSTDQLHTQKSPFEEEPEPQGQFNLPPTLQQGSIVKGEVEASDAALSSNNMINQIKDYKDLENAYLRMIFKAQDAVKKGKDITELQEKIHQMEKDLLSSKEVQSLLMEEEYRTKINLLSSQLSQNNLKRSDILELLESKIHKFKNILKNVKKNSRLVREENVLTLDGGGIRGIGTLCMLAILEMKTGKKTCELFDRIYGTSTGGLAGIMLARGQSATQVLDLYFDNADRIFTRGWWDTFTNPFGLVRAGFSPEGLENLIKEQVGEAKLEDVKVPVAVTTVNKNKGSVVVLSSEDNDTRKVSMLEAGRATSAAPTYYPAKLVKTQKEEFMAIDGGVIVNNPSVAAYEHAANALKKGSGKKEKIKINMYSFGTGAEAALQLHDEAGKLGFGNPGNIPGFFMNLQAQEIEDKMNYLQKKGKINDYARFQFDLPFKIDLADTSTIAKESLMKLAWARAQQEDFISFVKKVENRVK